MVIIHITPTHPPPQAQIDADEAAMITDKNQDTDRKDRKTTWGSATYGEITIRGREIQSKNTHLTAFSLGLPAS